MSYLISVIIASFQRPQLLKWNLDSLSRQKVPYEFETIVVNDGNNDNTETVCRQYQAELNLRYIFSGQRNSSGALQWRVPGFAYNIGVRQARGDILILACVEMYHVNNTIELLTAPLLQNDRLLGIPIGKKDFDGALLNYLNRHNGVLDQTLFDHCGPINARLPYLMAISRKQFERIGGYDEDFTGIAADDDDLVSRLILNGCQYEQTTALTVHLWHENNPDYHDSNPSVLHNRHLYYSRRGSIVRNQNREWGKLQT